MSMEQKAVMAKRNIVTVSEDDTRMISWDRHSDYETISRESGDKGRWHTFVDLIVKHKPTEKFYRLCFLEGNTEYQDNEYDMACELTEVVPVQVSTTRYEDVLR